MNILTLDFETFYSTEFSLSKITTEEYVRSPEFEVIGVSVQVDDAEPVWFSGGMVETEHFLKQYDWSNSFALAHNAMFDGAIMSWLFNIRPKGWLDTLSMARALHGTEVGGSLKVLAEHYELGVKGTEVNEAKGFRRADFTPEHLASYGEYCRNDVALTYKLFNCMAAKFPLSELRLIDLTLRMFIDPVLELDENVLRKHLDDVKAKKEALLVKASSDRDVLMSNPKFADLLRLYGVEPPMKVSPTTGKQTYAFAKNDEAFKELADHPNPEVQALVAARLGTKSTLEETRTERFIGISERGKLPVPLRYYAAHTGRWGGDDKLNLQNLPRSSPLKKAIIAPAGHVMIDSDSSQIEARTLAWLAGQDDLVEAFDRGEDVYKIMASAIYSKPTDKITKDERFVGKTTILGCIGAGTMILCGSGWKPIEQVTIDDKLWDGEEWVCHQGLQNSGTKETLNMCGIWLTPDHKVWSGTQWLEAQSLVQDESTLYRALGIAAENLPLQAIYGAQGEASVRLSSDVTADLTSTVLTQVISRALKAHAAPSAPKLRHTQNGTGCIQTQWPTTPTEQGFSIDWLLPSRGVTAPQQQNTKTTEGAAYRFTSSGEKIARRFLDTFKRLTGGITRILKWIGLTTTRDTNRGTYDLPPEAKICETKGGSPTLRRKLQTYDLAYAGPRNRYMVLTEQGPLIVHNCGYGMGAAKFQAQLKNFGVAVELDEAKRIIDTYRRTYPKIQELWKTANNILGAVIGDQSAVLGRNDILKVEGVKGILLPNGLHIKYPNLRWQETEQDGQLKLQYVYDTKKGKATVPNHIYGGKVVENVCQALARIVIGEQMLLINKRYRPVMTVHDAIACVVPESEADIGISYVETCMRTRPKWAPELPLNCEAGYGKSYGDC